VIRASAPETNEDVFADMPYTCPNELATAVVIELDINIIPAGVFAVQNEVCVNKGVVAVDDIK